MATVVRMKRRAFLQAIGGAVAAVFAPVAVSKPTASLTDKYPFVEYGLSFAITPPETVDELRLLIEATYETVGEIGNGPYVADIHGFGEAPIKMEHFAYSADSQHYYSLNIIGKGNNEREAVADALKPVSHELGGKELLWRSKLRLDVLRDFEEGTNNYVVRGRAVVLA